jgi:hypothetical protein
MTADRKLLRLTWWQDRWRRERDSNPRGTFWAPNRFRVDRLRPLGHPSSSTRTVYHAPFQEAGSVVEEPARRFGRNTAKHLRQGSVDIVLIPKAMTHRKTRPGGFEPPASSSAGKRSIHLSYGRSLMLAERLGFEPRVDLSGLHTLSRRAPSTARPPLLNVGPYRQTRSVTAKRRARDSNPHEPRGPVDFKSTALPVRTSPPRR